jgi:hypothetical protein
LNALYIIAKKAFNFLQIREIYENHNEEIKQRNKEYAEKVKYYASISPDKKKQYARTAYLNHKEKVRKAKELEMEATELLAGCV